MKKFKLKKKRRNVYKTLSQWRDKFTKDEWSMIRPDELEFSIQEHEFLDKRDIKMFRKVLRRRITKPDEPYVPRDTEDLPF